jgi:DNA-binding MarR family transcriptional regulator
LGPDDLHKNSNRWQPRKPQANGKSMWIRTFDGLALAMVHARIVNATSWAVLLAIHYAQQRDYHKRPQAITVREFAQVTGFARSNIQSALRELEQRGIIEVKRGKGRREASTYSVAFQSRWKEPGS